MRLHTMNAILEGEKKQTSQVHKHLLLAKVSVAQLNTMAQNQKGFSFPLCGDTVQFIKEVNGL